MTYTITEAAKALGLSRNQVKYRIIKLPEGATVTMGQGAERRVLLTEDGMRILAAGTLKSALQNQLNQIQPDINHEQPAVNQHSPETAEHSAESSETSIKSADFTTNLNQTTDADKPGKTTANQDKPNLNHENHDIRIERKPDHNQAGDGAAIAALAAALEALQAQLREKDRQLESMGRQVERLTDLLARSQEATKAAQALHASAVGLLPTPSEDLQSEEPQSAPADPPVPPAPDAPKGKKRSGLLSRINSMFSRS